MSDNVQRLPTVAERRKNNHLAILKNLEDSKDELRGVLPKQIPVERFTRVVKTAISQNPDILEASPRSVFAECQKAAADGLLPDGREGALVIFNSKQGKEVKWMPMIAGIRKKVRNSGEISTWDVEVVYEQDEFAYELGDNPFIRHKRYLDGDPGKVVAAYSIATFKGSGDKSREVMSVAQIEEVRKRSRAQKSGPWFTDYSEMCRKTVARRHSKLLPMSTDLDDLLRRDDELYDLEGASDKAAPKIAQSGGGLSNKFALLAGGRDDDPPNDEGDGDTIDADPETGEIRQEQDAPAQDEREAPADDAADASAPTIEDAHEQGMACRAAGGSKRDIPAEYRKEGAEELFDAWTAGFNGRSLDQE